VFRSFFISFLLLRGLCHKKVRITYLLTYLWMHGTRKLQKRQKVVNCALKTLCQAPQLAIKEAGAIKWSVTFSVATCLHAATRKI